jgi:hypothetical protein
VVKTVLAIEAAASEISNVLLSADRNRDNSVCIATGYKMDGRSSTPGRGKIIFSLYTPIVQTSPHAILL